MNDDQYFPESNSQAMQDLFVLAVSQVRGGSFIEIGGFHSRDLSNTHLLETEFAWRGVIIEIIPSLAAELAENRKSHVLTQDALRVRWRDLIRSEICSAEPDYLQVDCEPALSSLLALARVMGAGIRPRIVTFEHDAYARARLLSVFHQGRTVRVLSRVMMRSLGYLLVGPNVLTKSGKPFEDWWVRNDVRLDLPPLSGKEGTVPSEFMSSTGLILRYQALRRGRL